MEWRDRVYRAQAVSNQRAPEFPFDVINVLPEQAPVVVRHLAIYCIVCLASCLLIS